jgi:hypothetical protein
MALGSTQPLTEMSTGRPARKAENLTAICESIVYKMWEPRRLTTLWASTVCYRGSFTFFNSEGSGFCLHSVLMSFVGLSE